MRVHWKRQGSPLRASLHTLDPHRAIDSLLTCSTFDARMSALFALVFSSSSTILNESADGRTAHTKLRTEAA
jgi:hypothetical protein